MANIMDQLPVCICVSRSPHLTLQALLQRKYSASSDVWSYGIVMFEIWSAGCKPFEEKTAVEVSQVLNKK